MLKCDLDIIFFRKRNIMLRLFRVCIELEVHLVGDILTLLIY